LTDSDTLKFLTISYFFTHRSLEHVMSTHHDQSMQHCWILLFSFNQNRLLER